MSASWSSTARKLARVSCRWSTSSFRSAENCSRASAWWAASFSPRALMAPRLAFVVTATSLSRWSMPATLVVSSSICEPCRSTRCPSAPTAASTARLVRPVGFDSRNTCFKIGQRGHDQILSSPTDRADRQKMRPEAQLTVLMHRSRQVRPDSEVDARRFVVPMRAIPPSNTGRPMPPESAPIQLALGNRRTTTCLHCAVPSVSGRR